MITLPVSSMLTGRIGDVWQGEGDGEEEGAGSTIRY
jgi:hypothetical protein